MTPQQHFKDNKYVVLTKVADDNICSGLTKYLLEKTANMTEGDAQCPLSPSIYGDPLLDTLLEDLKPAFEEATGLKLIPTYSYARAYRPGDELKPHVDRKECEISATITLGHKGKLWPIYLAESTDVTDNPKAYNIETGDALIYKGMELNHWREKYADGEWQCQVFLHYVDANGKYKDFKYDKRGSLSNKSLDKKTKIEEAVALPYDDNFWFFGIRQDHKHLFVHENNFLSDGLIELIQEYGSPIVQAATVGFGSNNENVVDKKIRNAHTIGLPPKDFSWLYKLVEKEVTKINMENYKFNLDKIEHLTYIEYHGNQNEPGKYGKHTDGVIHRTRKLSFSVLLSDPDEYEGGDLLVWQSNGYFTMPKKKGTIVFFPSFTEHEVTPVTKGIRRSLVGWIHGPHFT